MKNLGFVFTLLLGLSVSAQSVLNTYQYVIVPTKFDGFRSENQYQTSTLVKFYLTNKGMNAFYDNAPPADLNTNRCKAIYAALDDQSTTFTTKVAVVFRDCDGEEQYRTKTGISKVKQYEEAYREALQEAFTSLKGYQYTFRAADATTPVVLNFGGDVKKLPSAQDPARVPEQKPQAKTEEVRESRDKEASPVMPMPGENMEAITLADAVALNGEEEAVTPISLYAQKTETGYQLVDTVPSIRFYLWETSMPDVFLAERKGQYGILYLKDGKWIYEFYQGSDRMQEELQIKF
ncbi:hypothetical protein SAMN06265375_102528 [Muriicola jejuensis]|uniref:Uncharacterized protein n=1 Tax=Muriicola jejuensis TaxID=504488 RepID=A0A6P0UBU2_9FLAO|nr:hypothetical protein [Muriicola jejuensis]NER10497.1 hypothetical protein [Muriicola jejuensis]SMP18493.1 hypothetical protein SAMN06265375_102528 [Muriicola jejuensis]